MMHTEPPPRTPPLPRGTAAPSPRGAPCAGLFGWRKDAVSPPKEKSDPAKPRRDYPAG